MSLLSAIYEQQPERAVLHGWFNMMGFAVAGLCANLYFLEVFVPMYSASGATIFFSAVFHTVSLIVMHRVGPDIIKT